MCADGTRDQTQQKRVRVLLALLTAGTCWPLLCGEHLDGFLVYFVNCDLKRTNFCVEGFRQRSELILLVGPSRLLRNAFNCRTDLIELMRKHVNIPGSP